MTMISTRTRKKDVYANVYPGLARLTKSGQFKKEVCANVYPGLARLTKSGQFYTFEELEKRRKELGKGTVEPVRNRVTTEEAEEFLKTTQKKDYSVIQQLNKSLVQISILALLLSSEVYREALLKVLKEMHVPTGVDTAFCTPYDSGLRSLMMLKL